MMQHVKTRMRTLALPLAAVVCVVLSGGCQPYQLTGVVTFGERSEVLVLSAEDAKMSSPGLEGASVELTVDPSSMKPRPITAVASDSDGRFQIPVKELGAGLLEYDLAVCARAEGYQTVYQTIRLPSRGRMLLVVMVAGRDTYEPKKDLLKETQDIADKLLSK